MNNTLFKFFQKNDRPLKHYAFLLAIFIIPCSYTFKNVQITNDPVIKKLKYDQTSITSFGVSNDVQVELMHPFDIMKAHSEIQVTHSEIQINSSGKITFTNTYEPKIPQIEHGYQVPTKTVSNEHGTTLYNDVGEVYYVMASNEDTPHPTFDGSNDELLNFGFIQPLVNLTPEDIQLINTSGQMVIIPNDHSYIIIDQDSRITIDVLAQTIFTETFVNDKMTSSSFEKYSIVGGAKAIRIYSIEKTYSTLLNGGLMEKTVRIQYDNYVVDDIPILIHEVQSNITSQKEKYANPAAYRLASSFEEQSLLNSQLLEVYPNPSYDMLNIEIHESGQTELSHYTIFSLDGKQMASGVFDNSAAINISTLTSGVYRIAVVNSKRSYYSPFSKI